MDQIAAVMERLMKEGNKEKAAAAFNSLIEAMAEMQNAGKLEPCKTNFETRIVRLKKKELSGMDKHFKRDFVAFGQTVRVTRRTVDGSISYEIRYRSNAYTITAIAPEYESAKAWFLEMVKPANVWRYVENPDEIAATLRFTKKECTQEMGYDVCMLMLYKWDRAVRVIKRRTADGFLYVLRVRRDGYNIEAQGRDLKEAKRNFKAKTRTPFPEMERERFI